MSAKEYRDIMKECGMCTKKWTIGRIKHFKEVCKRYLDLKSKMKRGNK